MRAKSFVAEVIEQGGRLVPLLLPNSESKGLGVMNPSIGIDVDGDLLINLRSVNYAFYNNEHQQKFPSRWGPLTYVHPENDVALRTQNYLGRLNHNYEIEQISWVDTSQFDTPPMWEFSGHEDVRIIVWGSKLYLTGVRRDTTTHGQGRMELSEISIDKKAWKVTEIARHRIPAPGDDNTYCEKNWVPILGTEYRYLKWSSPSQVVQVSLEPQIACETVVLQPGIIPPRDLRGSTHVLPWGDFYIAFTHEVDLTRNYLNQKNALYRHRLCVWSKEFKLIHMTSELTFLDARVEFACGALVSGSKLLVTFGFEDNCAFLLEIPSQFIDSLIKDMVRHAK